MSSLLPGVLLITARLALAATFLLAGAAKLASPAAAARAVADLGAPAALRPILRWLPLLELAIGVALGLAATTVAAAAGAALLLALFTVAIGRTLARGQRPDCRCFGQLRPAPISGWTMGRNLLLLALAGGLVAAGPPDPAHDAWAWFRTLGVGAQVRALVILATLAGALWYWLASQPAEPATGRRRGRATDPEMAMAASPAELAVFDTLPRPAPASPLRGDGLPVGAEAPAFVLPDLDGTTHALADLLAPGLPLVLVFSSPGCESCQALVPRLPPLAAQHAARLRLILVSRDSIARNRAKLPDPGTLLVLRQRDYELAEAFDITTSPTGVLVDASGRVAAPMAWGGLAVLALIEQAASRG